MLKKAPMKFDKELFKGTVLNNIKTLYRRTLEEGAVPFSKKWTKHSRKLFRGFC